MSRKRRNTSSPELDESPPIKRQNRDDSEEEESDEVPYVDQFSGQFSAFPGLGEDKGELFYGPADNGIDYLRMVRSEAKGVPPVMTAQIPSAPVGKLEEGEEIEGGGYYYDGAYTANHQIVTTLEAEPLLPPAQIEYYSSLLAQFRLVRATLRCHPPLPAVEALRPSQFISFPENTRKVRAQWESHMLSTDPHPVQVACMDTQTVAELVKFLSVKLEKMLRTRDFARVARIGAWAWAILGKCRDREESSNEEVGDIRELAQAALRVQEMSKDGHSTEGEDQDQDEERDNGIPGEEQDTGANDIPEKRPNLEGTDEEAEPVESDGHLSRQECVNVILDMIVTIAGEVYGQRDLLDLRSRWTEDG
ncbi:uncharacterized protein Z519_07937 [Cladophialophora bantiana CBS 173.52]|uniref:Uncharacterized protein n=1 Tax=Cladophialophora bantiana (strain ATCC 10958 / CBS 173.52 / CDC B-1940 / NIH 8579) TaxID=1442370 RepID=A0A0D2HCS1_CLAB1|nr:uncharacterized protein Z519_07937 [Cladophialophora bantiana CBS 173.52]KIW91043.1 hypothetical protein Z519_07937 [Cladophialophora bantiana CBS 173.52]